MFATLDASMATGDGQAMVEDLAVNAWRVRPGSVFFCIRGSGVDGHDWAEEAVANGAVAVVAERRLDRPCRRSSCPMRAPHSRPSPPSSGAGRPRHCRSSASPARAGRRRPPICCTRSSRPRASEPGLWGTIETQIGSERTPTGLWSPVAFHLQGAFRSMLDAGNLSCVIEATSYDSDLRRLDAIRFAALVFTNLGHDHLDYHGTSKAISPRSVGSSWQGARPRRSTSTTRTAGGSSPSFASAVTSNCYVRVVTVGGRLAR